MRERKPILNPKLRYEDVAFIRKRMACVPRCFSPTHRMYALLWPRLKAGPLQAHPPASGAPPSRFSRLYTILR